MEEDADVVSRRYSVFFAEIGQELTRAVGRPVLDDHNFFVNLHCFDASQDLLDGVAFVVDGYYHRNFNWRHRLNLRSATILVSVVSSILIRVIAVVVPVTVVAVPSSIELVKHRAQNLAARMFDAAAR